MAPKRLVSFLAVAAALATTCHGWGGGAGDVVSSSAAALSFVDRLRQMMIPAAVGDGDYCDSWRVGVEANNVRGWTATPRKCDNYVENYMRGHHYRRDSKVVVDEAAAYAEAAVLSGDPAADANATWVFDVDETALSHVKFYKNHGFGYHRTDEPAFMEWLIAGRASALPNTVTLYKKLLLLGVKIVFLSDRPDTPELRNATATNLIKEGFDCWDELILRSENSTATGSVVEYKSGERKKLEEEKGMVIIGNIGDQWSDLLGSPEGRRTFKLPNPAYYIDNYKRAGAAVAITASSSSSSS
ncbi:stem 28 kDa glycoprotein-like [Oryza glaberrima]|uniref:Acid phosphatase n=1 Tax=Oryza glaberrima TaxID=4538 RepID=I1NL09_ORYGL|nr:stem 28 kDa glycoprotein-like [Oryza glaberrima]